MIAEEFSFPVISSNNVANLPPLWRISSINREPENGRKIRKIFTSFSLKIDAPENDEKAAQEKMDVLWEDFNETVDADPDISTNYSSFREEFETLEVGSELKLVPAKGRRKIELVVKMMKKLLLLHNTRPN